MSVDLRSMITLVAIAWLYFG